VLVEAAYVLADEEEECVPGGTGKATSYVFVIDASGSMNDNNRIQSVKESARALVRTMHEDDEVALFEFHGCNLVNNLLEFTRDKQQFLTELQKIRAGGGTHISAGITRGGDYLINQASNLQKSLIVLTDGDEGCGGKPELATAKFREKLALLERGEVVAAEPPAISSISFVDENGDALDEVRKGDEFRVKVVMTASPSRCVDKESVTLEFENKQTSELETLTVEVVETEAGSKEFLSGVMTL
jgi:hypothetical protein